MDVVLRTLLLLAALGAVFVPLERAFPARPQRHPRPELLTDLAYYLGQALLFSRPMARLLLVGYATLGALDLPWTAAVRRWPPWLQAAAAMAAGDFVVYWWHRACHRFDVLWRFHAVHHTARTLDWVAAHREHPLDGFMTELCIALPAIVLGIDLGAIGGLVVFRGLWATFIHSNVRLPLGPLEVVFGSPRLHHWHHARVAQTRHNFGNLAPYLDVLFGTFHRPAEAGGYALGVDEPWPSHYLGQLGFPFRR